MYVPFRSSRGVLFIRAKGDVTPLIAAIRRAVRDAGTGHAMSGVKIMTDRLHDATARSRLTAQVFIAFAASALLLATIGIYGTLALSVSQRSREFAIRRALGADATTLLRMIGEQAATLAGAGATIGLILALVAARVVASVLYDVRALEPRVYAAASLLLLIAVVIGAALPSLRSMRIDPRDAMRAD